MDFILPLPPLVRCLLRSEGKDVLLVVVDKFKLIRLLLTPALN